MKRALNLYLLVDDNIIIVFNTFSGYWLQLQRNWKNQMSNYTGEYAPDGYTFMTNGSNSSQPVSICVAMQVILPSHLRVYLLALPYRRITNLSGASQPPAKRVLVSIHRISSQLTDIVYWYRDNSLGDSSSC